MSAPVVTPWCDEKHYDHFMRDGTPYKTSTYCTCSEPPGHTTPHKCWGCRREWPNVAVPAA